jgi:hypothetical protein
MLVHDELRFSHRIVGLQLITAYSFDFIFSLIMYYNSRWHNRVPSTVQVFLIGQSPQELFACISNILIEAIHLQPVIASKAGAVAY